MTAWLLSGLVLGLAGSLHCVGMCGPIALTLPVARFTGASRLAATLLYNFGRAVTYATLGGLLGTIGYSLFLLGFQRWISIALGAMILIVVVFHRPLLKGWNSNMPIFKTIRSSIGRLYAKPGYGSLFTIGLLNGLLPCGLVYVAIAAAVAGGDPLSGAGFMAAFGVGTLPAMWALSWFGGSMRAQLMRPLRNIIPFVAGAMGVLLILRGMELGIPFISPVIDGVAHGGGAHCHPE